MSEDSIAIIPARGGSKRIPHKNIKIFCGNPIIYYSIKAAINTNCFSEIMVSTDNLEIAKISRSYGATVPFFRSENASGDNADLVDVIDEVLSEYDKIGKSFKYFCCILPTAPFITTRIIIDCLNMLRERSYNSVFPVVHFDYPIQRALKMDGDSISMVWPENYKIRSQDLMQTFHDSGQFYWMRVEEFLIYNKLITSNTGTLVLPKNEVQDIDTIEDWELAEMKYEMLRR